MKKLGYVLVTALLVVVLAACGKSDDAADKTVKIGISGSDGMQWPLLEEKLEKEGIHIEFVEFEDYTLPNNALAHKDIDINAFQHVSFLSSYVKESGNDLVPLASTVFAPLGLYSEKLKDVKDIKKGDTIAIPDDPSNQARALKLLESAGLIELKTDFGLYDDASKITENPLELDIKPMVAQQTPQVLPDVAAAIINNGIAGQAGLSPGEDPLYREDEASDNIKPYINIFAVRAEDKDNETYKKIAELYQSEDIQKAVKEETKGGQSIVVEPQEDLLKTFDELKK